MFVEPIQLQNAYACGHVRLKPDLFILGLTSVVCHILSCFRGNAHDCV